MTAKREALPDSAQSKVPSTSRSVLRLALLASVFALALAVRSAGAQEKSAASQEKSSAPGVVQERTSVTVIEVPVNVIGRDGKPVAGLTAGDFELFDDGKKQSISGLDVIDLSKAPAEAGAPEAVPATARRLWLLVFDLTYTSPSSLARAREGARRFVTEGLQPSDLVAVGTLSVDLGWKLLLNFTRDRRQLTYAVETLGFGGTLGQIRDPLSLTITTPGPEGSEGGEMAGGKHGGSNLENILDMQRMQKQANDDISRGRVAKLIGSLGGIARVLDSTRGRKHVLFFSEGFESRLMSGHMAAGDAKTSLNQNLTTAAVDTSTPQGAGDAAAYGEVWKIDSEARYGSSGTRELLTGVLAQFNRSDAVLDTVDIGGLRADGDVSGGFSAGSSKGRSGSGTDALFAMAAATNGDLVRNANELGGELQKLQERTALVYLLIYQPKQLSKPGAFHALKVNVRSPGARVLARSGYYEPKPYQDLSPLERLLQAGDLVTGGTRTNEIQASLLAAPFASQSNLSLVPVLLEIPGASLLAGDSGGHAAIQIYVYANDSSGTLSDYLASEMALDLSKLRSNLESSGLKFYGNLYLAPGRYGVRALVRNATTGRASVISTAVSVPEIPGTSPFLLPPLFEEAPGHWVMVRGNPRADAPDRPAEYPFAIGGESFVPAALPTLSASSTSQVVVVGYNLGEGGKAAPLDVRAEVIGREGKSLPANVAVSRRSDIERGGGRKLLLDFQPRGLSPGLYALKVAVTDPASKKTAEASSPFEVR
ncbi:MAG TPA: VWA domain-containing protein [Thermoanaerobaculia bacterium]|nr:VWA domain-containing protein [Thermoanaerobaculia bacterium]